MGISGRIRAFLAFLSLSFAAAPVTAQAILTPPSPPSVQLVGINVADLDTSARFYKQTFGLQELQRYTFPHVVELVLGYPGTAGAWIVLVQKTERPVRLERGNGFDRIGLTVASVTETMKRVAALKLGSVGRIRQGPDAILGFIKDPDGYDIEIIQPNISDDE